VRPEPARHRAATDDEDQLPADEPVGARRSPSSASPEHVRRLGMAAGLVAPTGVGLLGLLLWFAAPDTGLGGAGQSALAYGLALLALPTTLLTGLPFYGGSWRVLLTLATSAALWLALGRWATRRADDGAHTTWRGLALELAPMTAGVWAGVLVGLGAMVFFLSP
jgi:hypothetical protein